MQMLRKPTAKRTVGELYMFGMQEGSNLRRFVAHWLQVSVPKSSCFDDSTSIVLTYNYKQSTKGARLSALWR